MSSSLSHIVFTFHLHCVGSETCVENAHALALHHKQYYATCSVSVSRYCCWTSSQYVWLHRPLNYKWPCGDHFESTVAHKQIMDAYVRFETYIYILLWHRLPTILIPCVNSINIKEWDEPQLTGRVQYNVVDMWVRVRFSSGTHSRNSRMKHEHQQQKQQ